jgi:simple sugar transport system ATP-binding protein
MIGITKVFPGVVANDKVNLEVADGEVHALLGENGAGKSTLMSILFGLYEKDSGIIKIRGKEVRIRGPNDATALGVGMVHQHFKLVENFTVTENIILGLQPL